MGLLIFISCFGGVIAGVAGYLNSYTRNAESILPDHDESVKSMKLRTYKFILHPSSFPLPTHFSSTIPSLSAIHSRHAFAILMRKEINHEQKFIR